MITEVCQCYALTDFRADGGTYSAQAGGPVRLDELGAVLPGR
jgi:hypothetical protein